MNIIFNPALLLHGYTKNVSYPCELAIIHSFAGRIDPVHAAIARAMRAESSLFEKTLIGLCDHYAYEWNIHTYIMIGT
jgi:hypothetical protein